MRRRKLVTGRSEEGIAGFLERHGRDVPEILYVAGLAWLEQAAREAREASLARWRHYPRGELRRIRRDVARALRLLDLAVSAQEDENARTRTLAQDLRDEAERAARASRRDAAMAGVHGRQIKRRERELRRPLTDAEADEVRSRYQ